MDETTNQGFGTSGVETGDIPSTETPQAEKPAAERMVLAGIGALAEACDNAEGTFNRLANRGQRVQTEWQDRAQEIRQQNQGARYRAREYVRSAMDVFLDGLHVPSKADVDTINVKLNILTRKLDDLQMSAMTETSVPPEPPASTPVDLTGDLAT